MGKRGGYRRERPVYQLTFEDPQFDGLEVEARSIPLAEFFELQRMQAAAGDDADVAEQVVRRLSGVITAWNLEDDDGKPVPTEFAVCTVSGKPGKPGDPCSAHQDAGDDTVPPCKYTGFVAQDLPFVLAIFQAWMGAVASVPNLSPAASNGGGTFPEQSLPMESP